MKIKRLVALAMASTIVISMSACSDKKTVSSNNQVGNQAANDSEDILKDVSLDVVLNSFKEFIENEEKNYSVVMSSVVAAEYSGSPIESDIISSVSFYDGVTYSKSVGTTNMYGKKEDISTESYTIIKEDGSQVEATKETNANEWDVTVYSAEQMAKFDMLPEETEKMDVEELKKSANLENKGEECYVTLKLDGGYIDQSGSYSSDSGNGFAVDVTIVYNKKDAMITDIDMIYNVDELNRMYANMGLEGTTYSEYSMKYANIKKLNNPIEIPAEISID